jgi:hypothetical protein
MAESWFWRVFACGALALALLYVVSQFRTQERPASAQTGSLAVVTSHETSSHRLYVVDSARNVILVYGPVQNSMDNFSLRASRYIEYDLKAAVGSEYPWAPNGYTASYMRTEVLKRERTPAPR